MVMTNSTYDGLCYNIDGIKQSIGDAVEVLHFDEAWYAYANFHEFYDGYHAVSSAQPSRAKNAITFATHSTHKLLAALSQASMIHVQNAETKQLDMARFNESFMMHTSTSPQYGIIASCDVAAAMMEQPAGRALIQGTIDEALSFRRAMTAVKEQLKGSWWFDVWQPDAMAKAPDNKQDFLGAQARRALARFHRPGRESCPGRSDQGHDPHARPVGRRQDAGTRHSRRRGHQIPLGATDRDREDRALFLPGAVLDGGHQGQVEHAGHRAAQLQGSLRRNAPLGSVLPELVDAHPEAYAKMGLKDFCESVHRTYREDNLPKAQQDMYTTLPEMAMLPADAYERLVRGRVESVEIDHLMGRTLAVMIVPYPPGIPLIMPGERITDDDQIDLRLSALCAGLRPQVPGLRDRHPRAPIRAHRRRQAISGRLRHPGRLIDDPARRQGADDPDSRSTSCSRSSRSSTKAIARPGSSSTTSRRRISRSR